MAQWMGRLGFELEPLARYVLHTIKQGERIFADETRLPTLAPGSGKVKTAWLWAYARDDRPFTPGSPRPSRASPAAGQTARSPTSCPGTSGHNGLGYALTDARARAFGSK